jgi:two-component system CheB/CheR fusion protein
VTQPNLTGRELQVLELVVAGQQSKQIAHSLGISQSTVAVHRAKIRLKLGAGNVAQFWRKAFALCSGELK